MRKWPLSIDDKRAYYEGLLRIVCACRACVTTSIEARPSCRCRDCREMRRLREKRWAAEKVG